MFLDIEDLKMQKPEGAELPSISHETKRSLAVVFIDAMVHEVDS